MVQRLPEDPMVQRLIAYARSAQMSRRGLMKGVGIGAAGAGALALSACAPGAGSPDQGDGSAGTIVWGNWPFYLDFDEESGTYPSLDAFMKQTNIQVDYLEDIDDNNTFYGKIKDQLKLGQHTGYDVITFTDWVNGRLITDGQIQELDKANMPNTSRLLPTLVDSLDLDPGRKFTMPWQAPAAGVVWNTKEVPDGIRTLDDLLRPELKGRVGVLSEMRDTMGIIMQAQGVDITQGWGDTEFDAALGWLDDALKSGQISKVKGNSYTQDLENDETLAAIAWTGDIAILNSEQGDRWTLDVPESGGTITADSFAIPNGTEAAEKKLAEEMINYYYEPEVAAMVADYVWFVTPVDGAREAMEKVNPDQVDNPYIFPDEEMANRLKTFRTLTPQEDNTYTKQFNNVLGV
ncbi:MULTISPECIES: PotD/PotF family extracellular solute-binding protein [unclassified Leucobacter]|uniref:ABC transporter substrate-binding protein n=1 Tax=unclassified Leucobacter TaxID=2621730 RepID=UPI00165E962B|nr:spermidine/putrescine ABC transporter substrate-binding protein [Leucobacter sp. CX169]MBC9926027.1 spermidine/putrescine ABC transporter substrate-binding protein [Leucobacter sp. cx-169]MBC9935680.1 spermidine/putrescine ABC transporter substrate-binding protein [Leucobacter sp. cx-87]